MESGRGTLKNPVYAGVGAPWKKRLLGRFYDYEACLGQILGLGQVAADPVSIGFLCACGFLSCHSSRRHFYAQRNDCADHRCRLCSVHWRADASRHHRPLAGRVPRRGGQSRSGAQSAHFGLPAPGDWGVSLRGDAIRSPVALPALANNNARELHGKASDGKTCHIPIGMCMRPCCFSRVCIATAGFGSLERLDRAF